MGKKLTNDEFIAKARKLYGDKYDYSKTDIDNRDKKGRVCIICHKKVRDGNEHGIKSYISLTIINHLSNSIRKYTQIVKK